MAVILTT